MPRTTKKQLAEAAAEAQRQSEQRKKFIRDVESMKTDGVPERTIASHYGLPVSQFRSAYTLAKQQEFLA